MTAPEGLRFFLMLQTIRSKISGLVAKVFFVLLAVIFGIWGIGDYAFLRDRERPVITVGSTEISPAQFDIEYRRTVERMRRSMGQMDAEMARQLRIADQVVDRMTNDAAIDQALASLGIVVSDDSVRARILADPTFRGASGQFDRNVFLGLLSENQMNEASFVALIRQTMGRDALAEALTAGTRVPDLLVDRIYRFREERRIAEYVYVPNSAITDPGQPTDEQVRETYEDNHDVFTRPELRALTVLRIGPDELAAAMRPSEEELREEYQTRRAELAVPERRDVEQIRFADETAARAARERIVAGTPFEDVAREAMGEAAAQLRLNNITRRELPSSLAAAFDLSANEVSEALRSPFGWHLLRSVRVEPGHEPTFEEARSRIELEVRRRLAAAAVYDTATRAEDALSEGRTIEQAATQAGVTPITVPAIDVDGKDAEGQTVAALDRAPEVIRAAFTTNAGQPTQLIDTREGVAFIVRVDRITEAQLLPLEQVRDRVVAMWQDNKRRELARARAQEILAKVNEGKSLGEAAEPFGLTPTLTDPTLRALRPGQPATLPPELVGEMFRLRVNQAGVAAGRDGAWVVRVSEIRPVDPAADAAGVTRVRDELRQQLNSDLLQEYLSALRDRYGVTVDRQQVERLTSSN